jgi:hypothetical protein
MWVYESDLKAEDGNEIDPRWVRLGKRYRYVRKSFSKEFRAYLDSRRKWIDHLTGFRDSLAHRIPLYIPPYIVSSDSMGDYNRLEREAGEALRTGSRQEYDRLQSEQKKFGRFRPWMTHSQIEGAPVAVFHWQLLQDYVTIDEFGRMMLEELDRLDKRRMASRDEGALRDAMLKPPLRSWIVVVGLLAALAALYWHIAH